MLPKWSSIFKICFPTGSYGTSLFKLKKKFQVLLYTFLAILLPFEMFLQLLVLEGQSRGLFLHVTRQMLAEPLTVGNVTDMCWGYVWVSASPQHVFSGLLLLHSDVGGTWGPPADANELQAHALGASGLRWVHGGHRALQARAFNCRAISPDQVCLYFSKP